VRWALCLQAVLLRLLRLQQQQFQHCPQYLLCHGLERWGQQLVLGLSAAAAGVCPRPVLR
jgi:hypothetical protein